MAFTFCTNCGQQVDYSLEKCPHCNHSLREHTTDDTQNTNQPWHQNAQNQPNPQQGNQSNNQGSPWQTPYGQNQYGPPNNNGGPFGASNSNSPYGTPNNAGPFGVPNNGGQFGGVPPINPQMPYGTYNQRKTSVGLVVFSIINIVFGFCCCGGFIMGIPGLIYALISKNSPDDDEEKRRKKISLVCNIVGAVSMVVYVIVIFVLVSAGVIDSSIFEDYMS